MFEIIVYFFVTCGKIENYSAMMAVAYKLDSYLAF